MNITKCDNCKKTLSSDSEIFHVARTGEVGAYASFEFCASCGQPITKMLKKRKLIKDNDKKHGGKK